jgi:hypothetical protein
MNFVTALALAVGLFVALPFIAHLLRRGKTEEFEFPPAALVPEKPITARQRSRLEDRVLLSLRALAVLALALLGATPLVRCSRLSVDRPAGASIALALVVDDSHSMQSHVSDGQRWELALSGARQLLASARTGDAIAVLLAGRPARVALSPTSDLDLVKKTLNDLRVTDRSTDLGNAVRLARSLLATLPQSDKRIIVLSDLADATWDSDEIAVSAPLTVLREATDNCAITEATRQGDSIEAQIACTSNTAAQNRTIARSTAEQPASAGTGSNANGVATAAATGQLAARAGLQSVRLSLNDATADQELTLSGSDADPSDDRATVTAQVSALTVGVLADPAKAAVITGGATVIEQALGALDNQIIIKPLSMLPDSVKQLEPFAALVIDDPPGLGPEARVALELWVKRGGVVLGLLGPAVQLAQLSSNLEPFTTGGQWQQLSAPLDARDQGASWLALEPGGLHQLSRQGRVRLDGVEIEGSQVALRWQDDVPLLLERMLGAGAVLTLGLPATVEISDLALRPVFLGLLGHTLELAKARRGPSQSLVGTPWYFRQDAAAEVLGPRGALAVSTTKLNGTPSGESPALQAMVTPDLAGMYRVKVDGQTQQRVVTLDSDEILRSPGELREQEATAASAARGQVDISRELALLLLSLLTLELLVRTGLPLIRKKTQFS